MIGQSDTDSTTSATASGVPSPEEEFLRSDLKRQNYFYAGGEIEERHFQAYLGVIVRYRWLIFFASLVTFICASYMTLTTPKKFRATSSVSIGSYVPPSDDAIGFFLQAESQSDYYIQNQLLLLKSYDIAKRVVTSNREIREHFDRNLALKEQVVTKDGNVVDREPVRSTLDAYLGSISYEMIPETTVARIIASDTDQNIVAKIANVHAAAFIELVKDQRIAAANTNRRFLKERGEESAAKIKEAQRKLQKFTLNNSRYLNDGNVLEQSLRAKHQNLTTNLSSAVLNRAASESELRELNLASGNNRFNIDSATRSEYLKLKKLEGQVDASNISNKHHPWLKDKKNEINVTRESVRMTAQDKVKQARIRYKANVEREKILREELNSIKKEFEKKYGEDVKRSQIKLEYSVLRAEHQSLKQAGTLLQHRIEDIFVNAGSEQKNVVLRDSAFRPDGPFSPNVRFNILLGLIFGPILGIALAYVLDFFDQTIRTPTELEHTVPLPVIGSFPHFGVHSERNRQAKDAQSESLADEDGANTSENDLDFEKFFSSENDTPNGRNLSYSLPTLHYPNSSESECFRRVRTILMKGFFSEEEKVLLVTSGQTQDGKSTCVSNLAISLALAGKKTLVIDGDLHLPSVHKFFSINEGTPGLSNYLLGAASFEQAYRKNEVNNLYIMPAGTTKKAPSELIASARMSDLLDVARREFDIIIIDSPPLTGTTDALQLSHHADGVIYVVRSAKTTKRVAKLGVSRLQLVEAKMVGTLLNAIPKRITFYEDDLYYSYY